MLVLRAFFTNAKWELALDAKKNISFGKDRRRLSITAVAEHPNWKKFAELVAEGLDCEVLSWKMDEEESAVSSTISHSLKKGHELATRTTEPTAVVILKGEIIAQLSKNVVQCVAFQTVRDSLLEDTEVSGATWE